MQQMYQWFRPHVAANLVRDLIAALCSDQALTFMLSSGAAATMVALRSQRLRKVGITAAIRCAARLSAGLLCSSSPPCATSFTDNILAGGFFDADLSTPTGSHACCVVVSIQGSCHQI